MNGKKKNWNSKYIKPFKNIKFTKKKKMDISICKKGNKKKKKVIIYIYFYLNYQVRIL